MPAEEGLAAFTRLVDCHDLTTEPTQSLEQLGHRHKETDERTDAGDHDAQAQQGELHAKAPISRVSTVALMNNICRLTVC